MAKLKAALANQQYSAAKAAAKKKSLQASEFKKQSIKDSLSGIKKGAKRTKAKSSDLQSTAQNTTQADVRNQDPVQGEGKGKGKGKGKSIIPFDKADTILLIGEANFSFTLSLLLPPHNLTGKQILSTAYDNLDVTYQKYPDAQKNVECLKNAGVKIEFGVDAKNLEKCKSVIGKGKKWSRIVFNFPHVGAGITDQDRNILTNQHLLLGFFRSVESLLTEGPSRIPQSKKSAGKKKSSSSSNRKEDQDQDQDDIDYDEKGHLIENDDNDQEDEEESPYILDENGLLTNIPIFDKTKQNHDDNSTMTIPEKQGSILITLLNCPPYTLWNLPKLASKPPTLSPGTRLLQPRYTLLRSFEFHPDLYKGYEHRRTIGWKQGVSKGANEEILNRKGKARTWEFVRREKDETI
ncbi:uncharacterized protein IL334_007040 [Kwoniella shivajii]|uniref:25S rRNA (uridine-N(3))-methyltransferase BMT5-like domain-containing protein n=1 Tax=Kwoniella shivajii TaxID=564305 RepID=A0ABZ1D7L3_9TREE|nr:hypothetical protein IL334_007040 [Kwoniella shivajii]